MLALSEASSRRFCRLKAFWSSYLHRNEVIGRRTKFDLNVAMEELIFSRV